jgi:hypothetical protein
MPALGRSWYALSHFQYTAKQNIFFIFHCIFTATRETAARHIFELFAPPFSSDPSESNSSSIISRLLQPTVPVATQPSAGRRNSLLSPLVPTNEPLPAQPLDGDEIGLMLVAAFCEAAYYDVQWAKVCLKLIERIAEVCALDRTWKQLLQLYRYTS